MSEEHDDIMLISDLRRLAQYDARAGAPLGDCMEKAADRLAAIVAERDSARQSVKEHASAMRELSFRLSDAEAEVLTYNDSFKRIWALFGDPQYVPGGPSIYDRIQACIDASARVKALEDICDDLREHFIDSFDPKLREIARRADAAAPAA